MKDEISIGGDFFVEFFESWPNHRSNKIWKRYFSTEKIRVLHLVSLIVSSGIMGSSGNNFTPLAPNVYKNWNQIYFNFEIKYILTYQPDRTFPFLYLFHHPSKLAFLLHLEFVLFQTPIIKDYNGLNLTMRWTI